MRVADRGDFPSLAAFQGSLAEAPLSDSLEGFQRTISLGEQGDALTLTYNLRELR